MFIPIEKQTSIQKMVEGEVLLMKTMHQYHLSQWGEYVYGVQSWKERRLLCESMSIPVEKWSSNLKIIIREVFLMKPKLQCHLSQ